MKHNRSLNDKSAQKEITSYIEKQKERGVSEVDILEISGSVRLPFGQINRIMGKFEKEGRVKEA